MFTRSLRPVVVQINHIGRHIRSPSRVDRYPDEESLPILSHRIKNLVRCFSNCAGFCAKQPPRRAPFGYNAWRAVQLSSFPYLVAPPTTQSIWTSGAALHVLRWLLCGPGGHEASNSPLRWSAGGLLRGNSAEIGTPYFQSLRRRSWVGQLPNIKKLRN